LAAAQANEEAPDESLAIWRQMLANRGTPQPASYAQELRLFRKGGYAAERRRFTTLQLGPYQVVPYTPPRACGACCWRGKARTGKIPGRPWPAWSGSERALGMPTLCPD